MGIFSRKPKAAAAMAVQTTTTTYPEQQDDAPKFERVQWTKEPGLRKLYFYAVILSIASATTGYDG